MPEANLDITRMPPSLWAADSSAARPTVALPPGEHDADLIVIGGGFTGLTAALRAAQRGAKVILLEAAEIGWGASGRNNGQVIPAMTRADPDVIVNTYGEQKGEALVQLIGGSANALFELAHQHAIDCQAVQNGWIQPAHRASRMKVATARHAQWSRRGFDVELLDRDRTAALTGSNFWFGAWQNRSGGHINPLAFARGLAGAALQAGAALYTYTAVTDVQRSGDDWLVRTKDASVRSARVIIATHAYSGLFAPAPRPEMTNALLPMRSYQMATQPLPEALRASILPANHAMSDTHGDLHFARLDHHGRLVTGGALIVPYGFDTRLRSRIASRLQRMFPQLEGTEIRFDYLWHGAFAATPDGVPRFHRLDKGLYTWLGCNGRGVALATAVGGELANVALSDDIDASPLPFSPLQAIAAHAIVKRTAIAAMLYYRWRDQRD